ncbi:Anaphase-promoting complex subunit 7 [Capsicum annuum]|nr:Anaphase-promoting complex subunit 7 [Capsicum annuum]
MGTTGESVSARSHARHMFHLNETSAVGCSHKPSPKMPQNSFKGPDLVVQVIFKNLQVEKQSLTEAHSAYNFAEDITTQLSLHDSSPVVEQRKSFAKMVMTTTEVENRGASPTSDKEEHPQELRNCNNKGAESENYGINFQNDNTEIVNWEVEAIIGKTEEAITNFEKVRSIDPYVITYMDEYAMLLKLKSDYSKLNKLVHDLLNIDPTRPEIFVALSVLWERKDERGALSYSEKSIRIDERHIPGYIMKGNLFLSMNRPEAAVVAFRGAQELRPDLRSYQGLVRSYLAISKIKEALHAAREAMKAMPQSAKALKLVGDVHASNTTGREKAKKFYESALRLEPGYLGAALALAELHVIEGRNGDAVSLLERYLKDWADDSLHVKLAQVFAATNMLQDALSHYQAALRINPQNEAAKKGLERLEKQLKGVDPDAPEEDEDNDVEDADADQEEAELL